MKQFLTPQKLTDSFLFDLCRGLGLNGLKKLTIILWFYLMLSAVVNIALISSFKLADRAKTNG